MKNESQVSLNPLKRLENLGQSIWLDFIRRGMTESGELARLIEQDGLTGITSNPAIFEKAIAGSTDYDVAIRILALKGMDSKQIYRELTVEDVKSAAAILLPVFKKSKGSDGFISLEVSPYLARDTEGTLREARELWQRVDCPNLMIKVPGTVQGLPAIRQLISEGINVNVTLLFSVERYREVMDCYLAGLEARLAKGLSLAGIASVASFFLSRIDVLIDPMLQRVVNLGGEQGGLAKALQGQVAICSAKAAYRHFLEASEEERFLSLRLQGAQAQRLLWASTSTKNPSYPDTLYVDSLIGPQTVNTVPLETLTAYLDHGSPSSSLKSGLGEVDERLWLLNELGIQLKSVTDQLEEEGISKFSKPYDKLLLSIESKRKAFGLNARKGIQNGSPV